MASPSRFEDYSAGDESAVYIEPFASTDLVDTEVENHNLLVLALHNIAVRIGWLFKTESVIIPAFLDQLSGAGWLRGLLPVLHRFGGSVPPILFARQLTEVRHKKYAMLGTAAAMAAAFFALGAMPRLFQGVHIGWQIAFFLALYSIFWVSSGLLKLTFGTLQSKLIRPYRFGALMRISMFAGTIPAIIVAWFLLGRWLRSAGQNGFSYIFCFAGFCFLVAGCCGLLLKERPDQEVVRVGRTTQWLHGALRYIRKDANFRRTILISMMLSAMLITLPHYQAMAREELNLKGQFYTLWVVIQSIGTGLAGVVCGSMADRYGNRLVLRLGILLAALTPALAGALLELRPATARLLTLVLFFLIGFLPATLRILSNYVLEISPSREAARYLGILALFSAMPFALSPLVGWWIDRAGFQPAFFSVSILLVVACWLTSTLKEPRPHVDMSEMPTEYLK